MASNAATPDHLLASTSASDGLTLDPLRAQKASLKVGPKGGPYRRSI
jgi:hypothetical protein